MSESTALTNWEERLAADAKAVASIERPSVSAISLRGGMLSYMDNTMPDNKMSVVVLGNAVEHAYYTEAYDADRVVPPSCFAIGKSNQEEAMVPHEVVPEEQRVSTSCASCPNFQWGSGRGRGKACGTRRRLALIPAVALDDIDTLSSAEIATLKVPVTSVRNWSSYVNVVAAEHQRPPYGVITEIKVVPDAHTMFKVHFSCMGRIALDVMPQLGSLLDRADPILTAPFEMQVEETDEKPAPKGKRKF